MIRGIFRGFSRFDFIFVSSSFIQWIPRVTIYVGRLLAFLVAGCRIFNEVVDLIRRSDPGNAYIERFFRFSLLKFDKFFENLYVTPTSRRRVKDGYTTVVRMWALI